MKERNYSTKKYLYGKAALEYWKVSGIKGVLEPDNKKIQKEFVVFTKKAMYRPQRLKLRTCKITGAEKYVIGEACTLPLVFLQLANEYSIHQLIYLGLQICSYNNGNPPLCSVRKLRECAEKLKKHRGRKKALRALKYIKSGSRSVMESILFMYLNIPNALGGCAIKGLVFNKKIQIKSSFKTKNYYADLYFPNKKLIIEYDSFTYHSNAESFSKDTIRFANLEKEGYQIISVRPSQLFKKEEYETLAKNICGRIKKSIRIRARKFFEGFTAISDLMKGKGQEIRSRFAKVRWDEIPHFAGTLKSYLIYESAWELLFAYPSRGLIPGRSSTPKRKFFVR